MRIVAGKYARRKLEASPGDTTRPIPDFVKESLFERLQHHLDGARFADVFAGTGTIGLEALSRGAQSVLFIEKNPKAFELLKKNVAALKVGEQSLCWAADAFRCSFRPKSAEQFLPCDFVFLDPPYKLVETLRPGSPLFKSVERISRPEFSAEKSILLLRTPDGATFDLPACWQPWTLLPRVEFSTMEIHLFQKTATVRDAADAEQVSTVEPDSTFSPGPTDRANDDTT